MWRLWRKQGEEVVAFMIIIEAIRRLSVSYGTLSTSKGNITIESTRNRPKMTKVENFDPKRVWECARYWMSECPVSTHNTPLLWLAMNDDDEEEKKTTDSELLVFFPHFIILCVHNWMKEGFLLSAIPVSLSIELSRKVLVTNRGLFSR